MHRMKFKRLLIVLLIGTLGISGCSSQLLEKRPLKPVLTSVKQTEYGVCFSNKDAAAMAKYIIELER